MRTLALAALLAACAGARVWAAGEFVEVVIPPGLSASETAELLEQKGVVRFGWLFRLSARYTGADRKLKPGTYKLETGMPLRRLLRELESGAPSLGAKVAIPEGFSTWQIAERLEAAGVCPAQEFLKHAARRKLEGYLFPTTYFFEPDSGVEKAAARMRQEFEKRIQAEYDAASPKPKLSLHQLVTLASIVEREAVLSHEKPTIAAVYLNRMRIRMRLEADPTVQYGLGFWKKGLRERDLRSPSPYNTYVHYGLPPGPICSPGLDSFRAALSPAQTDAIYFVADNTGGHIFSSTHEEHLKAKASFKRGLKLIKDRLRREGKLP